jgi:hypothetical protein
MHVDIYLARLLSFILKDSDDYTYLAVFTQASDDTLSDVSILPIRTKTRTCISIDSDLSSKFPAITCYRLEKNSLHPHLEVSRTLHALMIGHH